jgi:hypothetical protein
MALAEGRDPEHMAEGVEGHGAAAEYKSILTCGNAGASKGQILFTRHGRA